METPGKSHCKLVLTSARVLQLEMDITLSLPKSLKFCLIVRLRAPKSVSGMEFRFFTLLKTTILAIGDNISFRRDCPARTGRIKMDERFFMLKWLGDN